VLNLFLNMQTLYISDVQYSQINLSLLSGPVVDADLIEDKFVVYFFSLNQKDTVKIIFIYILYLQNKALSQIDLNLVLIHPFRG
jgi:hypothetical protein